LGSNRKKIELWYQLILNRNHAANQNFNKIFISSWYSANGSCTQMMPKASWPNRS
jgi:hypothetical protein